jgi:hypothetical protein
MDHIDEHLATAATGTNRVYPLAIKAALAIGKRTLNRYYNQTDHSNIFRIAMGTYFINMLFIFLYMIRSITSSAQAGVFQERRMGKRLGR